MADTLFLVEPIEYPYFQLAEAEMRHATKVLRLRPGDLLECTDGKGLLFTAILREDAVVELHEKLPVTTEPLPLHLLVSPTRQPDRLEWMLEKAVEFGLKKFTPLICERTLKQNVKTERLESIARAALKQSKRAVLPEIMAPQRFKQACEQSQSIFTVLGCCDEKYSRILPHSGWNNQDEIRVMIGPEGDFTDQEIAFALSQGIQLLDMGPARFRTETAALAMVSYMYNLKYFS